MINRLTKFIALSVITLAVAGGIILFTQNEPVSAHNPDNTNHHSTSVNDCWEFPGLHCHPHTHGDVNNVNSVDDINHPQNSTSDSNITVPPMDNTTMTSVSSDATSIELENQMMQILQNAGFTNASAECMTSMGSAKADADAALQSFADSSFYNGVSDPPAVWNDEVSLYVETHANVAVCAAAGSKHSVSGSAFN